MEAEHPYCKPHASHFCPCCKPHLYDPNDPKDAEYIAGWEAIAPIVPVAQEETPPPPGTPPPPSVLPTAPFPGRKQYHQHSPEILRAVPNGPWKRLSDLKLTGAIVVVGSVYWRPTDRSVDLYQITRHGLVLLLKFKQGYSVQTRRLARADDPVTSVISGKLTALQVTAPGGLLHKLLEVLAK